MNEEEIVPKEFRVYPHRDSTLQCVNLEAVDDPVLHFSLKTHKDATQTSKLMLSTLGPVVQSVFSLTSLVNCFSGFNTQYSDIFY